MYDHQAQQEQNHQKANEPTPGDYWHEMFMPIMVVIGVTPNFVIFCDETRELDGGWTWDLEKIQIKSRKEFSDRLHYQSEGMNTKCWADVVPQSKSHMWVIDEFRKSLG